MKTYISKCIMYIIQQNCKLVSIIWSYDTDLRFKSLKTKIHTFWISSEFKTIGKDISICYPINLRGAKYISIGNQVGIGMRSVLNAWDCFSGDAFNPEIHIGNNTNIGEDCHITAINKIDIGRNVLMGKKITITDNSHGESKFECLSIPPSKRKLYSKGPVVIEDGVWIGDKVTILPGVHIGKNAIIGANSLVTKDIPANCVAGGVPAKIIKQLRN